jgi:hypothetical protein
VHEGVVKHFALRCIQNHKKGCEKMAQFQQIYTERQRQLRISKEKQRLEKILGEQDDLASELISTAAFLKVEIEETEAIIRRDGVVEVYKNGDNQWGQKKSSAVEVHDKFIKNYQSVIKQIAELRSGGDVEQEDEFIAFIRGKK